MATGKLRINIDPDTHEALQKVLSPWGAQSATFQAISEWVIAVRACDHYNRWLGCVMDGRMSGEDIVQLGEEIRLGGEG